MKIRVLLLLFCFLLPEMIFSQTDISMSTHWYNRANYNPASIARINYAYLFSNVRKQWLGIEGAPNTYNFQASFYNNSLKSAFGISLTNDIIGITYALNPMFSYAYRISKEPDWSLSLGVSTGFFYRSLDISKYSPITDNDPILYQNVEPLTTPDAHFGIEFQNQHFIVGVSSTHILSANKKENIYLNSNHRYAYAIYQNTTSDFLSYYFGTQVANRYNMYVFEVNALLRFKISTGLQIGSKDSFEVGITYKNTKQLCALFGVNITPNLKIGYAYDQTFRPGYNVNGTHEIMLEYRIPLKSAECETCRDQELWYR